jgi:hypothetical protein
VTATIRVRYSCQKCELKAVGVDVPVRGPESVVKWMNATLRHLCRDHDQRSPWCRPESLQDIMVPIEGVERIGDAPLAAPAARLERT